MGSLSLAGVPRMAKKYAVIMDGPIGMSHELSRYADALYLVKLLSPQGQAVLAEIMEDEGEEPDFERVQKVLQRQFKKRFDEIAFQAFVATLGEESIKISDGAKFLNLKDFCAREDKERVDWDEVFAAFNMMITPVPIRFWDWSDDFPDFQFQVCPIKSGDTIRINDSAEVVHVCPRMEEQIPTVEEDYGEDVELENTSVKGIIIKVDWVETYTVSYTIDSPVPQQSYIVSGHIQWERLDTPIRNAMMKEMGWSVKDEPFGIAVAYLYTREAKTIDVLETVDGRDFAKPDKMRIHVPESDWTVEVSLRHGDVLSLACDVQRPDFASQFPDSDTLKRMRLPEIYFSIFPVNEQNIGDVDEEEEEEEEYRTLFAVFGFMKDGQFALRYLSGGDTQLFMDAETKTISIELLMSIEIWGDDPDAFEIERYDPLETVDEIFSELDDAPQGSSDSASPEQPLSFEKSAWWQSYLKDVSKKMDDDEELPKPKSKKKSDEEPKPKRPKKPKSDS
jgi:hypothetical protein